MTGKGGCGDRSVGFGSQSSTSSHLSSFVIEEIQLCFRCLGLRRILFVRRDMLKDAPAWKAEIERILNRPLDALQIHWAIWDSSSGALGSSRRMFASSLPNFPLRQRGYVTTHSLSSDTR